MDNARQSVGEPAPFENTPATVPFVFEWYENKIQEGLALVYRKDLSRRQKIVEVIEELEDAELLWKLLAKYEEACESCASDFQRKTDVLIALLARIYIAGTMRGERLLEP